MIIIEHRVEYKYGDEFRIKPLFDTHIGNAYCDMNAIRSYLSDTDDKTLIIGGGDTMDSIVVPDKRYSKHADMTERDAIIDEHIDMAYNLLYPYAQQIVGIGSGNHESVINTRCGTHPGRRLAKALNAPILGTLG